VPSECFGFFFLRFVKRKRKRDWIKIPSPVGNLSPKNPIGLIQSNNNFQLSPTLTASASLQVTTTGDQQNMTVTKPGYVADVSVIRPLQLQRHQLEVQGHGCRKRREKPLLI
jgi:hypothetical protein